MSDFALWVADLDAKLIAESDKTSDDFDGEELSALFMQGVPADFAAAELMYAGV
jgi:hypothetical protein